MVTELSACGRFVGPLTGALGFWFGGISYISLFATDCIADKCSYFLVFKFTKVRAFIRGPVHKFNIDARD